MLIAVVIATLSWGLAATFDKIGLNSMPDMAATSAVVVRQIIGLLVVCIWSAFTGLHKEIRRVPSSAWLQLGISGTFGVGIGGVAYFYAAQSGQISNVAVFCSGYPILTLLLAVPFLREALTWHKALGTLLVIGGLAVLSSAPGG